eukprot:c12995_g1_i1.p1 GENE.c12995_g1_i1~~c12995_g1_i1.p1  ORF type:complete len:138 (-),score=42.65 c12995_g1_i1:382-768(-)
MKFAKFVVAVAVVVAAVHGQVCVDDRDTTSTSPSSTIWLGSRHSYHKAKTTLNNINITSLSPFFPLDLLFDMPNITHQLDAGVCHSIFSFLSLLLPVTQTAYNINFKYIIGFHHNNCNTTIALSKTPQ